MTQIEALEQLVKTQTEQNRQLQEIITLQAESIKQLTQQNKALQKTIEELSSQVAWLNRQLFGRKSEK
jgi:septal ring factor EnvC (AmiA/AmiB activator)